MSAADIGRRKIEPRAAEYVAVGDFILDDNGREYEVQGFERCWNMITLELRPINQCGSSGFVFGALEEVRVRR